MTGPPVGVPGDVPPDVPLAGRLLQVGVVVPDLRAALAAYSGTLGLGPWVGYRFDASTVRDFTYRGRPATFAVDLAFTLDVPQTELIQVRDPGDGTPYDDWLARHARGGLHHLAVVVDDLAVTTERMAAAGYGVVLSGHGYGAAGDGAFAYFDTEPAFGYVLEAIAPPARRRDPDFTWPP